jgi:hypothetical protein
MQTGFSGATDPPAVTGSATHALGVQPAGTAGADASRGVHGGVRAGDVPGAYAGATAGMRSLTDNFTVDAQLHPREVDEYLLAIGM